MPSRSRGRSFVGSAERREVTKPCSAQIWRRTAAIFTGLLAVAFGLVSPAFTGLMLAAPKLDFGHSVGLMRRSRARK